MTKREDISTEVIIELRNKEINELAFKYLTEEQFDRISW